MRCQTGVPLNTAIFIENEVNYMQHIYIVFQSQKRLKSFLLLISKIIYGGILPLSDYDVL